MHRHVMLAAVAWLVAGLAAPAMAAPSPLTGRVEAEQMVTYNSNLLLLPDSPGDLLFRTKLGGTMRYSLPTRTLLVGQANANWINFATQGTYNSAMGIVNGMVMQPVFDFATVYGGGMWIGSLGLAPNGVMRNDFDGMLGGLLQTPIGRSGLAFGGYHLDSMLTEVASSAFFGHTFQVGYRHILSDDFSLTGGFRYMLKDMMAKTPLVPNQGRYTLGVTGRYAIWPNLLTLQGRTEYTVVTSDDPNLNTGMLDISLLVNGGF